MHRRLRVLVIDDDPAVQRVLRRTLEKQGYHPTVAGDGKAALEAVKNQEPDVVLLDLRLSGTSGREVYRDLLDDKPALRRRVIVLSGESRSSDDVTWFAGQGLSVLSKPFELQDLLATIERVGSEDRP